jgi:O-antigen ligase
VELTEVNIKPESMFKTILNYLAVFIVFSGSFVLIAPGFAEIRGFYFIIALITFLWLPVVKDIIFNKVFFIPFIIIVILSLYNVWRGFDTFELLSKQVIGISISAIWFYMLIRLNNYDIRKLFRIYLNIAFIVAVIGIIQEVSYLLNFKPGYDYKIFLSFWTLHPTHNFIRVNSILPEPAGFCVTMMPAVFVSLVTFFMKERKIIGKLQSGIILSSFILSFSSVGYIGLIAALFLFLFSFKKFKQIILVLFIILAFFLGFYTISKDFKLRVNDSLMVLCGTKNLSSANESTLALFGNARVAYYSFKESPLIGSGLGSHELNYRKFVSIIMGSTSAKGFANIQDGASLFLRIISEMGLFGIVLMMIFIFKFYYGNKKNGVDYLWIINNSALLVIFIRLLRVGHYFTDGFFLFFWMYYFSGLKTNVFNYKNT